MQPSPRTSVNPEEVHQEDREPEPAQEPDLAHEVYTACVEEVLAERRDSLTSDALPRVNLQREIVSYIDLVLGQAEIKTEQCEPDEISAYNQIEIIEPKLEDSSVAMAAAEGSCGVCGYSARGRRALAVHRCRVKAECKGKNGYESVDDIAESNARKARKNNKYKSPKVKNKVIISSGYFRCDSCPFTTIRKKVLDNHSKFHRQSNLDCATCGLTCSDLAELSRHSEEHVVRRTFQCRYCPFSSNYMWQLHRHRADEHPQVLPRRTPQQRRLRIPCPDCPFSCMHPSELAVHAARHHSRLQPYRCTACSYSCQGPHSLRRHTLIHTQPRSFRCDRCPYTSNLKHNLTLHRMSHTDEKPISCLVCGARFRRLFSLTVHSLIHSEKSFFCESCNFSCTHYSSLKRHRRMHEGDRRKYCPECTYACKLTESLLRHRSVEHGVKGLYPCHLCPFVADTSRQRAGHGRSHRANLIDPSLLYEKPVYSELHFVSRQSQKSKFKRGARKPGDIYVTFGDERFKMDEVPYAYSRLRIVCRRLTISEIIQRRLNHK